MRHPVRGLEVRFENTISPLKNEQHTFIIIKKRSLLFWSSALIWIKPVS